MGVFASQTTWSHPSKRIHYMYTRVCVCVLNCVQFVFNPMDCSPVGSSVHGISQARILTWVAISFSKRGLLLVVNYPFFFFPQNLFLALLVSLVNQKRNKTNKHFWLLFPSAVGTSYQSHLIVVFSMCWLITFYHYACMFNLLKILLRSFSTLL